MSYGWVYGYEVYTSFADVLPCAVMVNNTTKIKKNTHLRNTIKNLKRYL